MSLDYVFINQTNHTNGPFNVGDDESFFIRATERESYCYWGPWPLGVEELGWQNRPVGTIWTNVDTQNENSVMTTIEAVESVTVPAGTFSNCIRFLNTMSDESPPQTQWREWVQPGFFLIRSQVLTGDNPTVSELQSWSDR